MTLSTEKATLAETVYSELRDELLRGGLAPGAKIRISDIAARRGVSPSVLREALTRLAEQGLVVAMPQRGFAVAELSVEALLDLTRARTLIESVALRESIADGDLAWESSVIAAHYRLRRTPLVNPDGHVNIDWAEAHRHFHHTLLAGGKSTRLTAVADSLRDCSELYLYWSRELAHDDQRDAAAEHAEIAEYTLARDADKAAEALAAHIERTTDALVSYANAANDLSKDVPA
ncbi:GntR family transcriptional regulator [Mycolicibacter longobardus]|uniref:GntR family transcriptional regulator n=1 Tax=Mycolicibacter longobardus TaxID=1108812 RepID=A0A1X1YHR0_9MYCO|nr:GntR family transcriptional regulator [Mycolicibacter longobardus]ORW10551.1 GntR family transcriptional regulator [Mycolicibacter longobardus]